MLVVTDLRCWFHKFLKFVVPECGSGYRRKNPRVVEIRPLGCRESAGSNLARSTEPLHSLPIQGGSANRHVDQIHLSLFTAVCIPVQRAGQLLVISPCRGVRNDYEYFICGRGIDDKNAADWLTLNRDSITLSIVATQLRPTSERSIVCSTTEFCRRNLRSKMDQWRLFA